MLVEAMTEKEVTAEVLRDYDILWSTTVKRLLSEYDRERRKLKIAPARTYVRLYPIRTAAKNNWIIFLSKSPAEDKYKGLDSIRSCPVTYYHTKEGLWVFKKIPTGGLAVYTGHFFQRYNERMGLQLSNPLDAVKRFFTYNPISDHNIVERKGRHCAFGVCREGILLGEMRFENYWLLNKTFVSRNLFSHNQTKAEAFTLKELQKEIDKATMLHPDDPMLANYSTEVQKSIAASLID